MQPFPPAPSPDTAQATEASLAVSPASETPQAMPAAAPRRRIRTWPAALALLFISPGIAELLSGSTPPLLFVQPFALIFLPTLYGISVLLIREIVVRRHLNWGNALLMGAAFGIFQEALVVQTWYNYRAPRSPAHSMGTYGAAFGTSWNWALNLTVYHAVISITVPLILVGLLFPRQAALPWLGRKRIIAMTIWLLVACAALAYGVAFKMFASDGYSGPPLFSYLLAVGLTVLAMLLGAFMRFPGPSANRSKRRAPRLWTVRLALASLIVLLFVGASGILPATHLPAIVGALASAAITAFGIWRVRAWSARAGWGARHWLAVVTGVVFFFAVLWGPLVEFAARLPQHQGLVLADWLALGALFFFDQRLKRRERRSGAPSQPDVSPAAEAPPHPGPMGAASPVG